MRIQVITRDNGYGLSKDIQVLREALSGHDVTFTEWQRPRRGVHFHWNFHLELLNPGHFSNAGINAFVPNPEWMQQDYVRYFTGVDLILAKTRDCEGIMKPLHKDVRYIGWTSPDTQDRVDYTRADLVHFGGDSIGKGTEAVIEAASMLPEVPVTVVWKKRVTRPVPSNVRLIHGRASDAEFAELRKAPIHICPSSYEGFGHYINEARAMGAVIITTDAPPMDELVTYEHGMLSTVCSEYQARFAMEKRVCPDVLAQLMSLAYGSVKQHGPIWGARARAAYEQGRTEFHSAINAIVK